MKTKLVLRGTNAEGQEVLLAIRLRAEDNMVDVWVFPQEVATRELERQLYDEWREGKEVPFPEPHEHFEKELSLTESFLPEGIQPEREDLIQRAQTEWHFIVLSHKLVQTYEQELTELRERVAQLEQYDKGVWNQLKGFWDKVQEQVRDRNLLRRHANELRDNVNELFAKMKALRAAMDEEFHHQSREKFEYFKNRLAEITEKAEQGLNLAGLFEELKQLQEEYRKARMTRDHKNTIWDELNLAFKLVKEKRFGKEAASNSPLERLQRRYNGLLAAIEKMERSIKRDKDDLKFQQRKIERSEGQLEAQLRKAKIMMIEERVRSKEEKLAEMLQTKKELEERLEKLKAREAKKQTAQQQEAPAAAAPEAGAEASAAASDEPEAAATQKEDVPAGASLTEKLEDLAEDVIDTAKAVASVAADKLSEVAEELKEEAREVKEKAEAIKEKVEEKIEEVIPPEKIEELKDKVEETVEEALDTAKAAAVVVAAKVEEAMEKLNPSEETPTEAQPATETTDTQAEATAEEAGQETPADAAADAEDASSDSEATDESTTTDDEKKDAE